MQSPPNASFQHRVRQRTVFYLSGFDPKGAAHYHALYRDEAAKQAVVSGMSVEVGRRHKSGEGNSFWNVTAQTPQGPAETRYIFLRWDDIVRDHWSRNQLKVMWDIVTTTFLNLRHGSLLGMLKLSWPPVVALVSPFLLLATVLMGVPLLAGLGFSASAASLGPWGASAFTVVVLATWVQFGMWLQKKYSMLWLMRSYAFTAQQAQGLVPKHEVRLKQHAQTVLSCFETTDDDEILLVGHSSGTMMAVSILARALRINPSLGSRGPIVSLLTLGQCMPMLGCLPQAHAFRDDLRLLATAPRINWLDFTAPPDGCCFALVDPLAACGISEVGENVVGPKLLSPRFAEMFERASYDVIRRDKFRIHFQYLMASGKPVAYDYFAMTAGSLMLSDRFNDQKSVKDYSDLRIFRT